MISDYSAFYRPQTFADLVRELTGNIPYDNTEERLDSEEAKAALRHQYRYRRYRLRY